MKLYNQPIELIVDALSVYSKTTQSENLKGQFAKAGVPVHEIVNYSAKPPSKRVVQDKDKHIPSLGKTYLKTAMNDTEVNPWDAAHQVHDSLSSNNYVEPNINQEYTINNMPDIAFKNFKKGRSAQVNDNDFDPDWYPHNNSIWHLSDNFSQLKTAREAVAEIKYNIRIGHLDTGYSPTHVIVPESAKKNELQRNFVEGETPDDAHDPYTGGILRMPGHGTGTIGLLAGNKIQLSTNDGIFNDYLGGAPFAEVVCCRIAPSVVLFKTSAFAEALNYLIQLTISGTPIHVVSMSMGGAPTKAWADAVNAAYEAGITLVTAAGNNFNGLPTQHVIYPARFMRVIAACGVTNNYQPYHTKKVGELQGCYGPERHMSNALSAFTPNTPWASGDNTLIKFSGAGTSSATPQIAAAAALYYRKNNTELDALKPWQRVEAVRNALFSSALQKGTPTNGNSYKNCFGNGLLQANAALAVPVKVTKQPTEKAEVPWFPILNTLFKAMPSEQQNAKLEMYNTELSQLVFLYPELRQLIENEENPYENVSKQKMNLFREAVIVHPATSQSLKKYLVATHIAKI